MSDAPLPPMPLRDRVRWSIAYLRLHADRFIEQRPLALQVVCAATFLLGQLAVWHLAGVRDAAVAAAPEPARAWVQIIVYIVILIVVALIAAAMAPKPPTPEPGKAEVPVAEDGKAIIEVYGDVWVDDAMVLGFRNMGADPIRKKGGKK